MREGDRLLSVNGMRMGNVSDYVEARALDARRINLTLLRGNDVHDLTVELDGDYKISPEALVGEETDDKGSSVLA